MAKIIEKKDLRNRDQVFNDRAHAGRILAAMLMPYRETFSNPIVLAIPSGGVPVGKVISETLDMPFDLVIVRKIPIPYNTEAGFGSVSWDGEVELNNKLLSRLQLSDTEIESAVGDGPAYVDLLPVPGVPTLRFQRVPERKSVKNRVHLDVAVADLDEACAEVEALGGRRISTEAFAEYQYRWLVMADPEDNEFCLVIRTPSV